MLLIHKAWYKDTKIMEKILFIVLLSICILILIITVFIPTLYFFGFSTGFFPPPPSCAKIDKNLAKDVNLLSEVIKQLEEIPYESITIFPTDELKLMYASNPDGYGGNTGSKIPIPSGKLKENLKLLYDKGYGTIDKGNKRYSFYIWSSFDSSRGMIFTLEKMKIGKESYDGDQEMEIQPLSIPHWYYYAHKCER